MHVECSASPSVSAIRISTEEHAQSRENHTEPEWPSKSRPLPAELPDVPALPEELLPESVRGWVLDAAERLQVPAEMVAAPALVSAGALIGWSVGIRPKQEDDWVALSNLWGLVAGRPVRLNGWTTVTDPAGCIEADLGSLAMAVRAYSATCGDPARQSEAAEHAGRIEELLERLEACGVKVRVVARC